MTAPCSPAIPRTAIVGNMPENNAEISGTLTYPAQATAIADKMAKGGTWTKRFSNAGKQFSSKPGKADMRRQSFLCGWPPVPGAIQLPRDII